MITKIHNRLCTWADWRRNASDLSGYAEQTVLGKLMSGEASGTEFGCRIPKIAMTHSNVMEIDKIVTELPEEDQEYISVKYLNNKKDGVRVAEYCELQKMHPATFYRKLNMIHVKIQNRINMPWVSIS